MRRALNAATYERIEDASWSRTNDTRVAVSRLSLLAMASETETCGGKERRRFHRERKGIIITRQERIPLIYRGYLKMDSFHQQIFLRLPKKKSNMYILSVRITIFFKS